VIGLLRFVGVINAAVWLGAACLSIFGMDPGATSQDIRDLIGTRNFPYFSVAISQILSTRYFHLFLLCSVVAIFHVAAEWLYLGKYPKKLWIGLVFSLFLFGFIEAFWLQPNLKTWHHLRYAQKPTSSAADRAFRAWNAVSKGANVLALCGLAIYLWRVTNPADPARFVSATKFRS
jgi:hypothetical protein